ncbi:MAG: oxidoreductase [Bacteroidota bacterium]
MSKTKWTEANIPDLTGKTIIVTGGNSGLGYESTRALAQKGAQVILASRSKERGEAAKQKILAIHPNATIDVMELDLGSLDSVKQFAEAFSTKYDRLDVLMNNAGIMAVPKGTTKDGFESQLGVNHLGHFALTGQLLPKLESTPSSRIVNIASKAADSGKINFSDLQSEQNYDKFGAYSQSKLANILFTKELQKRLAGAGKNIEAMAAHPGGSKTNLGEKSDFNPFVKGILTGLMNLLMQPAERGALPQLFAAVDPEAEAGQYYGPDGFSEMGGYPKVANMPDSAVNPEAQQKLWDVSQELTGISYL